MNTLEKLESLLGEAEEPDFSKMSDKEYKKYAIDFIKKLEKDISKESNAGNKIKLQRSLKHWKSELEGLKDTEKK